MPKSFNDMLTGSRAQFSSLGEQGCRTTLEDCIPALLGVDRGVPPPASVLLAIMAAPSYQILERDKSFTTCPPS